MMRATKTLVMRRETLRSYFKTAQDVAAALYWADVNAETLREFVAANNVLKAFDACTVFRIEDDVPAEGVNGEDFSSKLLKEFIAHMEENFPK